LKHSALHCAAHAVMRLQKHRNQPQHHPHPQPAKGRRIQRRLVPTPACVCCSLTLLEHSALQCAARATSRSKRNL
jgi:hypothetical protein